MSKMGKALTFIEISKIRGSNELAEVRGGRHPSTSLPSTPLRDPEHGREVRPGGFTLVELLVVVSIIVVLLALLVPSMNKALYQAALMQCATNQKVTVNGSLQYAFDHKRRYPDRGLPDEPVDNGIQPHRLTDPANGNSNGYDVRTKIRNYIPINKALNDPLAEAVDLERQEVQGAQETWIYATYYVWLGWHYSPSVYPVDENIEVEGGDDIRVRPALTGAPSPGMHKIGDRWSYFGRRYNILVNDIDVNEDRTPYSSHPDFKFLINIYGDHIPWAFGGYFTGSTWKRDDQNPYRDPLDLNFGYDDGSVRRVSKVIFNDPRMAKVNNFNTVRGGSAQVPRQ